MADNRTGCRSRERRGHRATIPTPPGVGAIVAIWLALWFVLPPQGGPAPEWWAWLWLIVSSAGLVGQTISAVAESAETGERGVLFAGITSMLILILVHITAAGPGRSGRSSLVLFVSAAAMWWATSRHKHDFSAYRTAQCQAKHPNRDLQEIVVTREGEVVTIEVQANAFLHHMVRNIVGSLLPVGRGEQPESWPGELLRGRDRTVAGPTAPPAGLVFLAPFYPAEFGLPAAVTL